ncbi:MAG: VWA domain-containing protein [Pseudomonadota bacterium]
MRRATPQMDRLQHSCQPAGMLRLFTLATVIATQATANCTSDAMIVFDGSTSMAAIDMQITTPRIDDARAALRRALPQVERFRDIGLVTYGTGALDGCSNITVRLAPQPQAAAPILREIEAMNPDGMTPLTAAVDQAAQALRYRINPATIVLVTDGNETCGGTPCITARSLMAEAKDLTIHVIAFKFRFDVFGWNNPEQSASGTDATVAKCLSDATGGLYTSTETVEQLVTALNQTLGCPLTGMKMQIKTRL